MTNTESNSRLIPTDQEQYSKAISQGLEVIAAGGSKADAARTIYGTLKEESRDLIIQAFVEGATVTVKGAPTYFYNVRRQFERKQKEVTKTAPVKGKK